jgi:hypothetical protein
VSIGGGFKGETTCLPFTQSCQFGVPACQARECFDNKVANALSLVLAAVISQSDRVWLGVCIAVRAPRVKAMQRKGEFAAFACSDSACGVNLEPMSNACAAQIKDDACQRQVPKWAGRSPGLSLDSSGRSLPTLSSSD